MTKAAEHTERPEATEAYGADRAAALAGVPKSTLHYWASHEIWTPSVSPRKVRLWSLADIVVLRLIYWLRRGDKSSVQGDPVPRTTMNEVRRLLAEPFDFSTARLFVDHRGRVVREHSAGLEHLSRQQLARANVIDLLAEYHAAEADGMIGPSLTQPRPMLRIIPGKLAGEPHVVDTRLATAVIDALVLRGYSSRDVIELYPFVTAEAVRQANSLEEQLRGNLRHQAA